MEDVIYTNKITGEVITAHSDMIALSSTRRDLKMQIKQLEDAVSKIDDILEPQIIKAWENGEKVFMNYWDIRPGQSRFSQALLKEMGTKKDIKEWSTLKKSISQIEDKYKKASNPVLYFPKMG